MPDKLPGRMPEGTPGRTPNERPERMSEDTAEDLPDRMPEKYQKTRQIESEIQCQKKYQKTRQKICQINCRKLWFQAISPLIPLCSLLGDRPMQWSPGEASGVATLSMGHRGHAPVPRCPHSSLGVPDDPRWLWNCGEEVSVVQVARLDYIGSSLFCSFANLIYFNTFLLGPEKVWNLNMFETFHCFILHPVECCCARISQAWHRCCEDSPRPTQGQSMVVVLPLASADVYATCLIRVC